MPFDPKLDLESLEPSLARLNAIRSEFFAIEIPPPLARWLSRYVEGRGAHMSTRIEGNPMTERDVLELFEAEGASAESRPARENLDYRDAARFARQAGDDFHADMDGGLIRALHYLCVRTTDPYGTAGQYRTTQNEIRAGTRTIYRPPPPGDVPGHMRELIEWGRAQRGKLHALVLAAVVHAEFVKVHPFDDGNGRTARALSVYFFVRGGWSLRGYVGVEQVFGEDVDAYRTHLNDLGEAYPFGPLELTPWVRWVLGRLEQEMVLDMLVASTYLRLLKETFVSDLAERALPERLAHALGIVWLEGSVTAAAYAQAVRVSSPTASADLRRLTDHGLLVRVGSGRSTRYEPTPAVPVLDRAMLREQIDP